MCLLALNGQMAIREPPEASRMNGRQTSREQLAGWDLASKSWLPLAAASDGRPSSESVSRGFGGQSALKPRRPAAIWGTEFEILVGQSQF
jgi:hypothetical protein